MGVVALLVILTGAPGGKGGGAASAGASGGPGGMASQVTTQVPVGPGQVVSIGDTIAATSGCAGQPGAGGDGVVAPSGGGGGLGWSNGANGGIGTACVALFQCVVDQDANAGGGGGSTGLWNLSTGTVLAVAGGGGGGGETMCAGTGGGAGGWGGFTPVLGAEAFGSRGGQGGGFGAAGGQGGAPGGSTATRGAPGNPSPSAATDSAAGGGGGGGYHGGSGGGGGLVDCQAGGGGGGGSSLADLSGTGTTFSPSGSSVGTVRVSFVVGLPPVATISSPLNGSTFHVGDATATSYSCADGSGVPAYVGVTCTDSNGATSGSGSLDTSTVGTFPYSATAASGDGQVTTTTISYQVLIQPQYSGALPPVATISVPVAHQSFALGQTVPTYFACSEGAGGPGVDSCKDSHGGSGSSGTLDTSAAGIHTYTVTAHSADGLTGTANVTYQVFSAGLECQNAFGFPPQLQACITRPAAINPLTGALNTLDYFVGQWVQTEWGCFGQSNFPSYDHSVSTCRDSNGLRYAHAICYPGNVAGENRCNLSGAGLLDTSKPGVFDYFVTATDSGGNVARAYITYRVVSGPPTATIISPTGGESYSVNQVVATTFSCSDVVGGPGIVSCVDQRGSTSPGVLNTSSPGLHTYTVVATSADGLTGSASIAYMVNKPSPTLLSTASSNVSLGTTAAAISDSAVLSGGFYETGTLTFTLKQGSTTVFTQTDTVIGDGTYTASYTLPATGTATGTYTWSVSYSGDANNNPANDQGGPAEQTVVSPASPTLISTASPPMALGTTAPTISDSAVLSGGFYETGTLTFTLKQGGATVFTQVNPVGGNGTYSAAYTLPATGTATGTYTWSVSYSGDGNNNSANDQGGPAEQTVVSPASPTLISTASPPMALGTTAPTISDSAVLSGGFYPTGSLTFTLKQGSATVFTQVNPVSGNGTYSAAYTLPTTGTATGTYTWSVHYSGDGNNNSANDQGGVAEQTVVSRSQPALTTAPSPRSALDSSGATLTDTATLSGGYFETGTITFTLLAPGGATLDTETVTVTGNGSYAAPSGFSLPKPAAVGTYQWNASYSGDGNNQGASDTGDPAEQVTVIDSPITAAPVSISATEGIARTAVVATFSDPDSSASAAEYGAQIDWGDGTSSPGTVTSNGSGDFSVAGSHAYADEGSAKVTVTISDLDNPTNSAKVTSTATVADAPLAAGTLTVSASTEGGAPASTNFSFTDGNPAASSSDFTATINWGDGGLPETAPVVANGGGFAVSGSHSYADEGSYTVTVSVNDDGGNGTHATATAKVADATLTAAGVTPLSKQNFSGVVATFTDADSGGSTADFTTSIDWGDGSPQTAGTIAGSGGSYSVSGNHVYGPTGYFTVTVKIADDGGSNATGTSKLLIFAFPAGGSFVVGNGSATGSVTFWGSQWAKANVLSGARAPASFKGFEDSTTAPACGTSWTSDPGDSSDPPSSIPSYMAVVVSSTITKHGALETGDTTHVVIVRTDPGYRANPGHPGTGTVVATYC